VEIEISDFRSTTAAIFGKRARNPSLIACPASDGKGAAVGREGSRLR
jgi:hypothetical protein